MNIHTDIKKISETVWEIPVAYKKGMRVPARICATQKLLEKMGYRADTVANGKEAVKALEMIDYDLVLMDVQMPEMDGFEATRIIRSPKSNVKNHDVHIIATTAHAMTGDKVKCIEAGMDSYISKPIKPEKLKEAIEKLLC